MGIMKCDICSQDGESIFIAAHKDRGRIRICESCLKREARKLLPQKAMVVAEESG